MECQRSREVELMGTGGRGVNIDGDSSRESCPLPTPTEAPCSREQLDDVSLADQLCLASRGGLCGPIFRYVVNVRLYHDPNSRPSES